MLSFSIKISHQKDTYYNLKGDIFRIISKGLLLVKKKTVCNRILSKVLIILII